MDKESLHKDEWQPLSHDEACDLVRSTPIAKKMTYEQRLAVIKGRFGI